MYNDCSSLTNFEASDIYACKIFKADAFLVVVLKMSYMDI